MCHVLDKPRQESLTRRGGRGLGKRGLRTSGHPPSSCQRLTRLLRCRARNLVSQALITHVMLPLWCRSVDALRVKYGVNATGKLDPSRSHSRSILRVSTTKNNKVVCGGKTTSISKGSRLLGKRNDQHVHQLFQSRRSPAFRHLDLYMGFAMDVRGGGNPGFGQGQTSQGCTGRFRTCQRATDHPRGPDFKYAKLDG